MNINKKLTLREKIWEITGMIVGFSVTLLIISQINIEVTNNTPSTLSLTYLVGFFLVTVYWTYYGKAFNRLAISITNLSASLAQLVLIFVVLSGR